MEKEKRFPNYPVLTTFKFKNFQIKKLPLSSFMQIEKQVPAKLEVS